MSETSFPVNDLLRRKLQTASVIISMAVCVGSTIFLLLFSQKIGGGISSTVEGKLTAGLSMIFSPFTTMLAILIFIAGIIMMSFTAFIMMSQRTRDIGLMKAAGCPNDMLFGYFFTELLIVTFIGCLFGVILGLMMDVASSEFLKGLSPQLSLQPAGIWVPLAIFFIFFVLSLVAGVFPVLSAARASPVRAFSPAFYLGLAKEPGFRVVSRSNMTMKIAIRGMVRHRGASIRIVLCLSTIFLLITMGVAGGIIAKDTTRSWVERAVGKNVLLIAHKDVVDRYRNLLSDFYGEGSSGQFSYSDGRYLIPPNLTEELRSMYGNRSVDARLVLQIPVREVPGIVYEDSSTETKYVGDNRQGESLVVGVCPDAVVSDWSLEGAFLNGNQTEEAVVGDTVVQKLFSDPLVEGIGLLGQNLDIVGVCIDPLNNGNVTYVPLRTLQNITGVSEPNVLMMKLDTSANTTDVLNVTRSVVLEANPDFQVFELNVALDKSLDFIDAIWSTIMLVPLLSLITASLSLLGYVVLTVNEQRQELGVLRALGAKPKAILGIVCAQSLVVLLASYAVGVAFGSMTTLLILMQNPLVLPFTVLEIAGWLILALILTFASSIYPAFTFARRPVLETMVQI